MRIDMPGILLDNLIAETYRSCRDPFKRMIFLYQNKQLAAMMEDYAGSLIETPMPLTTRFYETILTHDCGIEFMARLNVRKLETIVNAADMPCHGPALELIRDAAAHIRGYYEEPFYARFLRAAHSIQSAETLINAAGLVHGAGGCCLRADCKDDLREGAKLSMTAVSRFISLYATLRGVSFNDENNCMVQRIQQKAA